jgi:hypothetical protein
MHVAGGASPPLFGSQNMQSIAPNYNVSAHFFSVHLLDCRWRPSAVNDGLVGPVDADVERERAVRRRQPVAFLVLARRFGAGIQRQRSVRVEFAGLCAVLLADVRELVCTRNIMGLLP